MNFPRFSACLTAGGNEFQSLVDLTRNDSLEISLVVLKLSTSDPVLAALVLYENVLDKAMYTETGF